MQPVPSTPLRRELRGQQGYRPLYFVGWGLLLWLVATVIFRLAGQWFLVPDNALVLGAAYYGAVPLIALVTLPLYRLFRLDADTRVRAAVLIALPGMLLDMVTTLVFDRVFPNLEAEAVGPFSSWLFWAYGLILASGFVGSRNR
jgi:hypothetical protein